MLLAVGFQGLLDDLLPGLEVTHLTQDELVVLGNEGATLHPPLEPLGSPLVHEEVKQSSEADTYDGVLLPAVLVALMNELMMQQGSSSKGSSLEGLTLCIQVFRVDGVQVHLTEVAVKVFPEDLATGVESVTMHAVVEFAATISRYVCEQRSGDFGINFIGCNEVSTGGQAVQHISVSSGDSLWRVLNCSFP